MTFFRVFQHLLPSGAAWTTTITKTLRKFFLGLSGAPQDAKDYIDDVFDDAFPATTRELAEWEKQFGLPPDGSDSARRLALAAEWAAGGGQSPSYIQGVLQTAGFPVYVHEWWDPGTGLLRDPHAYTTIPLIGTVQCSALADQPECSALADQSQCNRFLVNDPHYFANKNLTEEAPPPIPADAATWPYFIYVGGPSFGDTVTLDPSQRAPLERLLLKLRPLQDWIVTFIDFADPTATLNTEGDDPITTETDVDLLT